MSAPNIFQTPEFNRATHNVADTGVKIFFKWVNMFVSGAINFVTSAIKMALGK